jgi:hypothetical protein
MSALERVVTMMYEIERTWHNAGGRAYVICGPDLWDEDFTVVLTTEDDQEVVVREGFTSTSEAKAWALAKIEQD